MSELLLADRNKKAALYGVLLGVANIVFATIAYTQVSSITNSGVASVAGGALSLTILALLATQIKKANGGYLDFKATFGVIFVMLLIGTFMYIVYNFCYMQFIDPEYLLKTKAASLHMMKKLHPSEADLDKFSTEFDKKIAESKKFNLGNNLLTFLMALLLNCMFGIVIALIVRKERPMFEKA